MVKQNQTLWQNSGHVHQIPVTEAAQTSSMGNQDEYDTINAS